MRSPSKGARRRALPTIVFDSPEGPPLEVDRPEGGRLLDVCDERLAPIPFSCRSASCGTCRVDVLEGHDLLEPPQTDELEVLAIFGDDPRRRRLACQTRVRPGVGRVCVRATTE
ncbi:MAG TPA: 2Fe-2S iron-sulfur cluster-binding protein [Polyangiaceae bacterium]|nr:2Fe-2S iron-sulfur cluster-binding protein [Polyangiaceae bacterium]